jgi:hypothetical protein
MSIFNSLRYAVLAGCAGGYRTIDTEPHDAGPLLYSPEECVEKLSEK